MGLQFHQELPRGLAFPQASTRANRGMPDPPLRTTAMLKEQFSC